MKEFNELSKATAEVVKLQGEREATQADILNIINTAKEAYYKALDKYDTTDKAIEKKLTEATAKNENDKQALSDLTQRQVQAEIAGETFTESEEVERLKRDISTFPQIIEGLTAAKQSNAIDEEQAEIIAECRSRWNEANQRQCNIEELIKDKLAYIKHSTINECAGTLEYVPGLRVFLPENIERKIEEMKKE